jgi:hypothetical protein
MWKPARVVGVSLVIFGQPAAPCGPRTGSFNNRSFGRKHEAAVGLRKLHHLDPDPFGRGGLCRPLARIDLIDIGQGDRVIGDVLNTCSQKGDSLTIAGRPPDTRADAMRPNALCSKARK